jgi:hypothetical protein
MYEIEIKIPGQESIFLFQNTEEDAVREAILQFSGMYFLHPEIKFGITVWKKEPEIQMVADFDRYKVEG